MSSKTLVIFLATTPYGFQNTDTALRLAEAALTEGHRVRLFASADGVHVAQAGQRGHVTAYAHAGDMRTRGLTEGSLVPGCQIADDAIAANLLAAAHATLVY